MVIVESEQVVVADQVSVVNKIDRRKKIGLSNRELDKFETILTRQHRNEIKSIRNNFRNSSLDDSHLFNNCPSIRQFSLSNSISANLNDFQYSENNKFVDIKNNLLKISSSSSDSNSAVVGSSSPSNSITSLEKIPTKNSSSSSINKPDNPAQSQFSNSNLDVLGIKKHSKLLSSLSSDLDEDEIEECQLSEEDDDQSSYSSRRQNKDITIQLQKSPTKNTPLTTPNLQTTKNDVTSLSSMTSNYSQFDFLKPPVIPTTNSAKISNNPIASFFFSNSIFSKKVKPVAIPESPKSIESNKFDLFSSRLLSLKPSTQRSVCSPSPPMPYSLHSSSSSLQNYNETQSIKSNVSSHNLSSFLSNSSSVSNDLKTMPNSVLIFENRPSNLPAKSQQEASKHKLEYQKMVEQAKKKEFKENQQKFKKYEQQLKKEDFMANSLRIWNNEILPNWKKEKLVKRTHQLWWHGLPPSIRGKVWELAIGNDLNLTHEIYQFYKKTAQDKLETLSKKTDKFQESSVELIKLDVSRTFPQLCFFQRDGPYHEALHSVLGAYACYNPKIGYVQGMSFLTAILLLNMEAHDAFICLANLLDMKYLLACFCMDQIKMNRYFRVHEILLEHNLPKLYKHFIEQKVKPDLYLIEWIFTLFSKSLPLDVMSRVWDVFFRDKEVFLFRTALGILSMYRDTLIEMDFIHIVQFLTKLPENINATHLFKAIEQIKTNIDESYFTFEQLMEQVVLKP